MVYYGQLCSTSNPCILCSSSKQFTCFTALAFFLELSELWGKFEFQRLSGTAFSILSGLYLTLEVHRHLPRPLQAAPKVIGDVLRMRKRRYANLLMKRTSQPVIAWPICRHAFLLFPFNCLSLSNT